MHFFWWQLHFVPQKMEYTGANGIVRNDEQGAHPFRVLVIKKMQSQSEKKTYSEDKP